MIIIAMHWYIAAFPLLIATFVVIFSKHAFLNFHLLSINRDRSKDNQKEIKRQDMNNEQMQKGYLFFFRIALSQN